MTSGAGNQAEVEDGVSIVIVGAEEEPVLAAKGNAAHAMRASTGGL